MERLYFDHAATTPLLPEVVEAMQPWLGSEYGNPSSLHAPGRKARAAIDSAREMVANALVCEFGEVVFTSGGTEAVVTAIIGSAAAAPPERRRILISSAEHKCVIGTGPLLAKLGFRVDFIDVDHSGCTKAESLDSLMGDDVLLVVTMHANNEVGSITDVHEVTMKCRQVGALHFVDAVQTFGTAAWPASGLSADLVAISGHKIGGPKGIGALLVRAGTKIAPLFAGGGQERELRGGTENVAGILGLGTASRMPDLTESRRLARNAFLDDLRSLSPTFVETLPSEFVTLDGFAHLRFPGIGAETLLIRLDRAGVSASSGSACSSGSMEPSHVLAAMGWSEAQAKEALRFTFGRTSTIKEAVEGARRLALAVDEIGRSGAS